MQPIENVSGTETSFSFNTSKIASLKYADLTFSGCCNCHLFSLRTLVFFVYQTERFGLKRQVKSKGQAETCPLQEKLLD